MSAPRALPLILVALLAAPLVAQDDAPGDDVAADADSAAGATVAADDASAAAADADAGSGSDDTAGPDDTWQDFEVEGAGTPWEAHQAGAEPAGEVRDGALWVLNGMRARGPLANGVGFARTAAGARRRVELSTEFVLSKGAHGGAFALLDTRVHGASGAPPELEAWEEPDAKGVLALALDVFEPPTAHWFDEHGNVHARPQRTLSLHADGTELWGGLSPVEFRDGEGHALRWVVEWVPGGAYVEVSIDEQPVLERRFFAHLAPFEARLAVGGRTGAQSCNFLVDDLRVRWGAPHDAPFADAIVSTAFQRELLNVNHRSVARTFTLPDPGEPVARVVLDLVLEEPTGGWDQWDRGAGLSLTLGEGEQRRSVELVRYMTPFRREWTWSVDVTHLLPWLRGEVELRAWVDSWVGGDDPPKGFWLTTTFHYVPGEPERVPLAVIDLWNHDHSFGGAGNTPEGIAAAYPERRVPIDPRTTSALVEVIVSGHGGFGEFTPAKRELEVNGRLFADELWTTDVWLNPVRPQSGTWKFDRAGWAPGSVVRPWALEVGEWLVPGEEASIVYRPLPFDELGGDASHKVSARLVLFGEP